MTSSQSKIAAHPILVVEDDEGIRETLRFALELEGYEVLTAENGQEALNLLHHVATTPCLVFLDLMMPVMNGWEFAAALEQDSNLVQIPLVVLTAFGDQAEQIRSNAIIKKPVKLDDIFETAKKWCGQHQLRNEVDEKK